ncbi:MAG: hypothetical protein M3N53_00585 [Actinomycetota bacterium]|nr:hypothetical protein [Actinomycetota bacterium]
MKRPWGLFLVALALTACAGPDPNLTESGKGKPRVTVGFPETAEPGQVVTAAVQVSNPGPGDIGTLVVSFARVGDPSLPEPIVEPRRTLTLSGIEEIRPEPTGQSAADATFTFPGVAAGASTTIEFDLRTPDAEGTFGNSIQVYDGAEIDRAAGARIQTEVR